MKRLPLLGSLGSGRHTPPWRARSARVTGMAEASGLKLQQVLRYPATDGRALLTLRRAISGSPLDDDITNWSSRTLTRHCVSSVGIAGFAKTHT